MASAVFTLDVVALFDSRERGPCLLHRVSVDVVTLSLPGLHPVRVGMLAYFVMSRASRAGANQDINDDVALIIDDFEALVDGRLDIYIPDSATVHQHGAMEVLRREDRGDRA